MNYDNVSHTVPVGVVMGTGGLGEIDYPDWVRSSRSCHDSWHDWTDGLCHLLPVCGTYMYMYMYCTCIYRWSRQDCGWSSEDWSDLEVDSLGIMGTITTIDSVRGGGSRGLRHNDERANGLPWIRVTETKKASRVSQSNTCVCIVVLSRPGFRQLTSFKLSSKPN